MIDSVAGIIIWTSDFPQMLRFYTHTLGLEPYSVRNNFVSFKWDMMRLSISTHSQIFGKSADPYRIMVNFSVNDIQDKYHLLTGRGVDFIRTPEREKWGGWIATFNDPDGNVLQLIQFPKD